MSTKYSAGGRPYLDVSYEALTDVPDNVLELGELADPGADSYLTFDVGTGELAWLAI
jgi:hypothetical protein